VSRRLVSLAFAAAALPAVVLSGLGCSSLGLGGGTAVDGGVAIVTAARENLEVFVPADGYLEATEAKPVAVPQVPTGALQVKELVEEGSLVEKGDIVVVFDDTQLSIDLDNHKASFRSAERRIDSTEVQSSIEAGSIGVMRQVAELERDTADSFDVDNEEIFSKLEILDAQVKKEEAGETILFADASLLLRGEYYDIEERILGVEKQQVAGEIGRVETSLGNLVLKAPIGGLILYKKNWRGSSVAVGDTLWPGNVIMSIVDPASAALTAFVLEKDAGAVEKGASARVYIDARPEKDFEGTVTKVSEVSRPIEQNSPVKYTEIQVKIQDAPPGLLKPGMKGHARIQAGRIENAVVIPRSALRGSADAPFVIIDDSGSGAGSIRRDVKTGPGDLAQVSVVEGLEGGESIVVGGDFGGEVASPAGNTNDEGPKPRRPGRGKGRGRPQGA